MMRVRIMEVGYRHFLVGVVMVLWFFLAGCVAFGPKTIPPDRFNYNEAISSSRDEQILLNIVRVRYLKVPVFLNVASVLTQYIYTGNLGASGSAASSTGPDTWGAGASANLGYTERPTITYVPLAGSEFARRLLSPIPVEAVFSLAQSGWRIDQILPICLQQLNDLENMSFATVPSPKDFERLREFRHVLALFFELGKRHAFEMYCDEKEIPGVRYLIFSKTQDPETQRIIDEVKQALGLDPQRNVFRITDRLTRRRPDEITVKMRSVLAMMLFLSWAVEVPEEHLEDKRVVPMVPTAGEETYVSLFPWRVRSGVKRPKDAFAAVRYQGYWFYIGSSDHATHRAMALLSLLFQLLAPDVPSAAPILSLPTG